MEAKYSKLYEDRLNPFKEFTAQQQLQRYKNLTTSEKVTLNVGRFAFSTKYARTFVFFYGVALHLLVFLTLWTHTVRPHC